MLKARGIIHCHSCFSHDGQHSLEELSQAFREQGFQFVAFTEHSAGISRETYEDFVARCQALSSDEFVLIPGLEILCTEGVEVAGIGLEHIIETGEPNKVSEAIKLAGGFSVWVHPRKRGELPQAPYVTDAIELLNGKEDGAVAPSLRLLRTIMAWREKYAFKVITGFDLHVLGMPLNVWTECEVDMLSQGAILSALHRGEFWSIVSGIAIPSSGNLSFFAKIQLFFLRILYMTWNKLLVILPDFAKGSIVQASRPIVRKVFNLFRNGS